METWDVKIGNHASYFEDAGSVSGVQCSADAQQESKEISKFPQRDLRFCIGGRGIFISQTDCLGKPRLTLEQ